MNCTLQTSTRWMRQHFALQNQTLPNTPGRFQPEWVVGIGRNRWLASPEYARQGSCLVIPSRPPPARAGNQVAKFSRNRWPLSAGIGGQLPPEYAPPSAMTAQFSNSKGGSLRSFSSDHGRSRTTKPRPAFQSFSSSGRPHTSRRRFAITRHAVGETSIPIHCRLRF